jgi:hypothetical protein
MEHIMRVASAAFAAAAAIGAPALIERQVFDPPLLLLYILTGTIVSYAISKCFCHPHAKMAECVGCVSGICMGYFATAYILSVRTFEHSHTIRITTSMNIIAGSCVGVILLLINPERSARAAILNLAISIGFALQLTLGDDETVFLVPIAYAIVVALDVFSRLKIFSTCPYMAYVGTFIFAKCFDAMSHDASVCLIAVVTTMTHYLEPIKELEIPRPQRWRRSRQVRSVTIHVVQPDMSSAVITQEFVSPVP